MSTFYVVLATFNYDGPLNQYTVTLPGFAKERRFVTTSLRFAMDVVKVMEEQYGDSYIFDAIAFEQFDAAKEFAAKHFA